MKAEAGGACWALSVTGDNDSTARAMASGISCKIRDKWTKSRQMREREHVYMHLDTHTYTHESGEGFPSSSSWLWAES